MKLVKEAASAQVERNIALPPHCHQWQKHSEAYEARITLCWKKYERRNRELAHVAANLLIMLALLADCRLICGENLTTLKTIGRGRGVRGRKRLWRNNTTVRGELWRVLTYHQTRRYQAYRLTDSQESVKPTSYTGGGATRLLLWQGLTARPSSGKCVYYSGWSSSIALRTSQPKHILALLSTSQLRKRLLLRA